MATNKELKDQALTLGEELGISVTVEGLNNAALTALVESLTAQKSGFTGAVRKESSSEGDGGADDASNADGSSGAGDTNGAGTDAVSSAGGNGGTGAGDAVETKAGPAPKPKYRVAPGRNSLTSPRGILVPGALVKDSDYSTETLQELYEKGFIVRE